VKKKLFVVAISLIAMLGFSMAALGQDPQIELTGVSGTNYGGYYTGIYYGTLSGVPTNFICDDATHDVSIGDIWNTNTWGLATGANDVANAPNGQFTTSTNQPTYHLATATTSASYDTLCPGGSCSLQDAYDAVAYLAYLLLSKTYTTDPPVSAIQYAIWSIMDNPPAGPGNNNAVAGLTTSDTGYWIYTALTTESGYQNPAIMFYSPDGNLITQGPDYDMTAQEFISYNPSAVPEPRSLALMGTVLALSALVLGRKRLFA